MLNSSGKAAKLLLAFESGSQVSHTMGTLGSLQLASGMFEVTGRMMEVTNAVSNIVLL